MREIEVKIKLTADQEVLLEDWLKANAQFEGESSHREYYLNDPTKPFTMWHKAGYKDASDYLRVRFEAEGGSVCLKQFEINPDTMESKNIAEIEYDVDDPEETLKLFAAIGFSDQTEVRKVRRKYQTDAVEIVIDDVAGLGKFAEFELKAQVAEHDEGVNQLLQMIKQIGFAEIAECRRGYVSMLWNPQFDFTQKMEL